MAHHMPNARLLQRFSPSHDFFWSNRLSMPLLLIAREELDSRRADLAPFEERMVNAPCRRGVSAEPNGCSVFRHKGSVIKHETTGPQPEKFATLRDMSDAVHSILRSARAFFFGTAMSRFSGFFRDMVMAFCFGSAPEVASFMVAYRLANLFRRLFGENNAQSGFVSPFERLRTENLPSAFLFYRDAAWSMGLLLLAVVAALEGALFWIRPPVDSEWHTIATLAMWMVPGLFFICLHALHTALLQCQKKAFLAAVAPVIFNATWIGAALLSKPHAKPMHLLAMGVTLAYGLQWLFTARQIRKETAVHIPWTQWVRPRLFSPEFRSMGRAMMLGILGVGAIQINGAIDAIFSKIADPSGPAYLWYALRLEQLPLALFGIALSGALLPPLARAAHQAPRRVYAELLSEGLRHALAFIVPCTFGLLALGFVGLNLLYGHGDFTPTDIVATAQCLAAYALGLIPAVCVLILAQGFYGQKTYSIPSLGSLFAVGINIALNAALVFWLELGAVSIALATSASAWANLWFLTRSLSTIGLRGALKPGRFAFRLLVISALSAGAALSVQLLFNNHFPRDLGSQLLQFALSGAVYLGGVLGLARCFQLSELFNIVRFKIRSR